VIEFIRRLTLPRKLQSRKWWVATVTQAVIVLGAVSGADMSDVQTTMIAIISAAYILSEAIADGVRAIASALRSRQAS
jgi:hypothetical protein